MKKCMCLLFVLFPVWVSAQKREIMEAASGDDLTKKASTRMQYLFPEFINGDVYYLGSPKGSGKLNYNMLLGEMQFLENDEVLSLANVKNVIVVAIDNRKFYPFGEKEFAEELLSTNIGKLWVRRKGNVIQHSKKEAYGTSSSTSATTSYSSINSDGQQYKLSVRENVMITLNCYYYLVDANGKHVLIRNQKTFTKQFPEHKTQIETFVRDHHIRFDNEDDLKSLLEYCSELHPRS